MTIRDRLLALLRVPPEPEAVAVGEAERVFRAAPNYFRYKRVAWTLGQLGALAALVGGLVIATVFAGRVPERWAGLVGPLVAVAEGLAVAGFLVQLPLSYMVMKLDFEMRWYILTDRSLRIREGVLHLREKTMTFANIQQITIRENPLQRLLGIADVKVRTAGGGGGGEGGDGEIGESMHEAYFRGVDNAEEIRTAIRERVRLHQDSGLGDPDEASPAAGAPGAIAAPGGGTARGGGGDAVAAARELRDEVRLLRSRLAAGQRAN